LTLESLTLESVMLESVMLENLTPAHSMYRIVSSVAERILSRREDIKSQRGY